MLTRIISGAVGALILAVILYFHDTILLPVAVAAMIAVMIFELVRAVKLEKSIPILLASEIAALSVPFITYLSENNKTNVGLSLFNLQNDAEFIFQKSTGFTQLLQFSVLLICSFIIFLIWLRKHNSIRYEQVFFVLAVMIIVPQAMSTMIRIERTDEKTGLFLLIMALCGAWIADTGAYFTGVAIGKHKLCPEISPKKTIEGFIGGILTTAIAYSVAFSLFFGFTPLRAIIAFITGAFCAVVGAIGDLSASMVKRQIGFKDYGKIMPGHGGLMDRFDSVLFVLPTFYAFIAFFGIHMYS